MPTISSTCLVASLKQSKSTMDGNGRYFMVDISFSLGYINLKVLNGSKQSLNPFWNWIMNIRSPETSNELGFGWFCGKVVQGFPQSLNIGSQCFSVSWEYKKEEVILWSPLFHNARLHFFTRLLVQSETQKLELTAHLKSHLGHTNLHCEQVCVVIFAFMF